jgi:hypothetical protein
LIKPLRIATPVASAKLDDDYSELNQLASGLQQIGPQLEGFAGQDNEWLDRLTSARAAHILLNNGFGLPAGTFSFPKLDLESAAAAEAEALAERQKLRHALREVAPALSRRLELGLRLALGNFAGDAAQDKSEASSITELVTSINQSADACTLQQELAEALMTLDKINEVKSAHGENPPMRRALAAQEHAVQELLSKLNPQADAPQSAAAVPRLQIAKSIPNLDLIRKENREWLQDYDRKINELVRLAVPSESFVHA